MIQDSPNVQANIIHTRQLSLIILTGDGDLATAANAMCAGAVDVVGDLAELDEIKLTVLQQISDLAHAQKDNVVSAETFKKLTKRELDVMDCVIAGHANKVTAYMLGISQRTVEHHRQKMMTKLGVANLPELVRLYMKISPLCAA
jgi:two-component system, LuxR family, response regulator FixJ